MADKKIVLAADGSSATVSDAKLADLVTTAFSTNEFVSGTYGLIQKGLFVGAGMALQQYRINGTLNPFA